MTREGLAASWGPESLSDGGALSSQHVFLCAAACDYDRSRNPAPGRTCSTENQTFFKKNLENLADDVTFLPNTYPRSLGLKEEGGEG